MDSHQAALLRLECLKLAMQLRMSPTIKTEPFTEIGVIQTATIFADFVLQEPVVTQDPPMMAYPAKNFDWGSP